MKPSTAKTKGRATEALFVEFLRQWAPYAERRRLNGADDRGDITGVPGVVFEVKSGARLEIAAWLNELEREIANDRAVHGALVVRPPGKPDPADWFAVLPLPALMELLVESGWLAEPTDRGDDDDV